jgi:hypothetical protein
MSTKRILRNFISATETKERERGIKFCSQISGLEKQEDLQPFNNYDRFVFIDCDVALCIMKTHDW